MHTFISVREVEESLARLAEGPDPLVLELPRRPGQKESRWVHLLGDAPEEAISPAEAAPFRPAQPLPRAVPQVPGAFPAGSAERLAALEAEVAALRAEVEELKRRLSPS